jgi:SAM-dependent methyltransferase
MACLLGDLKGKELLDFGSGMGEEACYFAKLGARVTAIDISGLGVELTRKRAQQNGLSVRVMQRDLLNSGLPSNSFDLVHGFGILHHVGVRPGLREVHRLLRTGGRAVFGEHMNNSAFVDCVRRSLGLASAENTSKGERAVKWRECGAAAREFAKAELYPYYLTFRLRNLVPVFRRPIFKAVDYWFIRLLPPLRFFAGGIAIYLEK